VTVLVKPGISRDNRISDQGLERLRKQLESGAQISQAILQQWVKRYGDQAVQLLAEFDIRPPR
jgi:hypothetical protein